MPAVVEMSSTPHGAMDSTASNDKKRNKLGYHRTSVACVHCRRRKIRCLVAADDAHGRCENCIRLRKECQFFPVDQQPPIEKKSRPSSRLESVSTTSSSPPILSGQPSHHPASATAATAAAAAAAAAPPQPPPPPSAPPMAAAPQIPTQPQPTSDPYFSYHPIPMTASQEVPFTPAGGFAGNPISPFQDGMVAEFNTQPSLDPSLPWDEFTTISDPQMLATMNAVKPPPPPPSMMNIGWHAENTPLPTTPTIPSQSHTPALNTPAPTFAMQPDGSVWPVPPAAAAAAAATPVPVPPPSAPPRSMTFPTQPEVTSYPGAAAGGAAAAGGGGGGGSGPDPKQMAASPNAQSFPGTPVHAQHSPDPMQMPMSMSYPGHQAGAPMGFPAWPEPSGLGVPWMFGNGGGSAPGPGPGPGSGPGFGGSPMGQ